MKLRFLVILMNRATVTCTQLSISAQYDDTVVGNEEDGDIHRWKGTEIFAIEIVWKD